jgi:hypothetical protein
LIAFEDPNGVKKWHIEQNYNGKTPGLNVVETGVADFRFFIKKGGNVGIGTGSPEEKLHIKNGTLRVDNGQIKLPWPSSITLSDSKATFGISMDTAGAIVIGTDGYQIWTKKGIPGWNQSSDLSLKSNIYSLNGILSKIIKLNPVHFQWKSSQTQDIGFIAQEVEEIFPELISSVNTEKGKSKGLDYTKFGILAIASVKEIVESLEELSQQYQELAIENQALLRRLEVLENQD